MEIPCHPRRRTVAQGEAATIEACACGTLHVTLGALTVRLRPEVVASLWETLGEALEVVGTHRHVSSLDRAAERLS